MSGSSSQDYGGSALAALELKNAYDRKQNGESNNSSSTAQTPNQKPGQPSNIVPWVTRDCR